MSIRTGVSQPKLWLVHCITCRTDTEFESEVSRLLSMSALVPMLWKEGWDMTDLIKQENDTHIRVSVICPDCKGMK